MSNLVILILVISALFPVIQGKEDQERVVKASYGTVFHKVGGIQVPASYFSHTFAIPIPRPPDMIPHDNLQCSNDGPCTRISQNIKEMIDYKNDLMAQIKDHIKDMRSLLPLKLKHAYSRTKRAVLELGAAAKSLFGFADANDVEHIRQVVNKVDGRVHILEGKEHALQDRVVKMQSTLSAFSKLSNKRIDNAMTAIKANRKFIQEMAGDLEHLQLLTTTWEARVMTLTKYVNVIVRT